MMVYFMILIGKIINLKSYNYKIALAVPKCDQPSLNKHGIGS